MGSARSRLFYLQMLADIAGVFRACDAQGAFANMLTRWM